MPFNLKHIFSPILEITYAAKLIEFPQKVQVNIRDHDHFSVGGGFCFDPIGRKRKIAGGDDQRLGKLDIHIVYIGEIAHTARNSYITFIFDRAREGAVANT